MDETHQNTKTLTGRYVYVGNPCTMDPCLPGMAYALQVGDRLYFITTDHRWFSENRGWNGYTPQPEDRVTITGYCGEKKDVYDNSFYTIECLSLTKAKAPK